MFWLDLVTLLLIILFWIGVCYIVWEFLKQWIDKRSLEAQFEDLQSQFVQYQRENSNQMQEFKESYKSLYQKYTDYQQKVSKGLEGIDNDIDAIVDYTNQMVQINQDFFRKIDLISAMITQGSPSQDKIEQLVNQISHDIEMQKMLLREQAREIQQRRADIEKHRERNLHQGQELDR